MKLKIDKAGRIVVPKPLRDRMGFRPDTALEAIERPEGILLKTTEQTPSMTKIDGLWVHVGIPDRGENWHDLMNEVRQERIDAVAKG